MNFVTFGNETINLDNVTHITVDKRLKDDDTELPFISFNFVNEETITFSLLTWDNKPVLAYHQAKVWLENFQQQQKVQSGICLECGRFAQQLSATGYCEGCVMQAVIDSREE